MKKNYNHLRPTLKEALEKGASFCAYQERCQQEVREKLYSLKLDKEDVEEVLSLLIQEKFIDEVRFAKAYSGGKFRQKKWGRKKITQHLKLKQISDYCIKKGLEEISETAYLTTLKNEIEKKKATLKDKNQFTRKNKLINYALSKGYEYELILEFI